LTIPIPEIWRSPSKAQQSWCHPAAGSARWCGPGSCLPVGRGETREGHVAGIEQAVGRFAIAPRFRLCRRAAAGVGRKLRGHRGGPRVATSVPQLTRRKLLLCPNDPHPIPKSWPTSLQRCRTSPPWQPTLAPWKLLAAITSLRNSKPECSSRNLNPNHFVCYTCYHGPSTLLNSTLRITVDTGNTERGAWERTSWTLCVLSGKAGPRSGEDACSHAERGKQGVIRLPILSPPAACLCNSNRDGQRANAAGDGRDGRSNLQYRRVIHVSAQPLRQPIDADVDDDGSWLHHRGRDEFRAGQWRQSICRPAG